MYGQNISPLERDRPKTVQSETVSSYVWPLLAHSANPAGVRGTQSCGTLSVAIDQVRGQRDRVDERHVSASSFIVRLYPMLVLKTFIAIQL